MAMSRTQPRLVCLGNFTVDHIHLPDGRAIPDCMGGDALFAALGARLWEPAVEIVAPIGKDLPTATQEAIQNTNFRTDGLAPRDSHTLKNHVYYDSSGGRRWEFLYTPEDFIDLSPRSKDIPNSYINAEAFLLLAMALESQEEIAAWLRKHTNALIALDTQEDYTAGNENRILQLASQVDIFLPSAKEAHQLLGHKDWERAAKDFAALGPAIVVIKLGPSGALIYAHEPPLMFIEPPASGTNVIDTTGAGDAFCGGFMAAYLQDKQELRRAARAGAISASYAISSFGMEGLLTASSAAASQRLTAMEV